MIHYTLLEYNYVHRVSDIASPIACGGKFINRTNPNFIKLLEAVRRRVEIISWLRLEFIFFRYLLTDLI